MEDLGVIFSNVIDQRTFFKTLEETLETKDLERHKASIHLWDSQFLKEMLGIIDKQVSPRFAIDFLYLNSH